MIRSRDDRVERLAGDGLDDLAQRHHVDVGVQERLVRRSRGAPCTRWPTVPRGSGRCTATARVGRQPGGVGEQVADRDVGLAVGREFRQVATTGAFELDRALLDLLHRRDRGEQLRQRGQVEDGVLVARNPLVRRQFGGLSSA